MTVWLMREGNEVNPKRVRRFMRLMGLEAVYPKPHLSHPSPDHKIYPYLLSGVVVDRPDQVWSADPVTGIFFTHAPAIDKNILLTV